MNLFDVYPRFVIDVSHAKGNYIYNTKGQKYLDLYGGHGVISIGHSHPRYVQKLQEQLGQIGFYSNSVEIPLQKELENSIYGEFSSSHVFYYSLLNGISETFQALLAFGFYYFSGLDLKNYYFVFLVIFISVSLYLFSFMRRRFKNNYSLCQMERLISQV